MQICDMCKKIATIRREEQIALYHYLVHFELIGSLIVTHNNFFCKENSYDQEKVDSACD